MKVRAHLGPMRPQRRLMSQANEDCRCLKAADSNRAEVIILIAFLCSSNALSASYAADGFGDDDSVYRGEIGSTASGLSLAL